MVATTEDDVPTRPLVTIVTAMLLVGCGGSADPVVDPATPAGVDSATPDDAGTAVTATPTAADAAADEPPPAPPSEESCGDPAQTIELGTPIEGSAENGEPVYFCVEVPPGQAVVTFTLDGLTADLDLFVAYDTFEDLGGGFGMRFSDANGTDPDSVTFEPSAYRGELIGFESYADVSPGPYWVEVVGDEADFTLTVTGQPV